MARKYVVRRACMLERCHGRGYYLVAGETEEEDGGQAEKTERFVRLFDKCADEKDGDTPIRATFDSRLSAGNRNLLRGH